MKNRKQFIIAAMSAGILFSSCKKGFLDVNTNPNTPTDANITPQLIFVAAAEGVGATPVGARASGAGAKTSMQFAQNWVGYMAGNGDFARDATETSYNIDFSFGNTLFLTRLSVLYDLHQAEVKGLATGDTAVAGASIILTAKMYQELVDLFGNLPYTQAFQPDRYPRPAYDKAEAIYADLQKRLDTAITYMKKTPIESFGATTDIVNHGNTDKWIKFANTLKLRLLIRQSRSIGNPTEELAKIEANGGILGVGESVAVNPTNNPEIPGYSNDENKQSPFYANYGYTVAGAKATTGTNANEYIIDILANSNDARIARFFLPIGNGTFFGNPYGPPSGELALGGSTSYFGPGIVASASQDQWIMPDYESLFFKAEAIARGWMTGNVQDVLNQAITRSFVFLKVPDAQNEAAAYIEDNFDITKIDSAIAHGIITNNVNGIVNFIAYQKYIANTCIDAQESYSDIRRLDFLTDRSYISKDPARISNSLPVRLLYPQSEYTTNGENVNKEGIISALTSKIFWQN